MSIPALAPLGSLDPPAAHSVPAGARVRTPEPGFARIRAGILGLSVLLMALTAIVVAYGSIADKAQVIRSAQREALTVARAVDQHLSRDFAHNPYVDSARIVRYFEALGVSHTGAIAIITPRGEFLMRHPFVNPDPDPAATARVASTLRGREGVLRMPSPMDGALRVGAYRRIGEAAAYAAVTYLEEDLLADWRLNTLARGAIGVLLMSLTALFTWLLLCRVHGERAAALNLAKFRRAVDLSGDMVYWMAPDGRVLYANDSAARRLGLDPRRMPPSLAIRDFSRRYTPRQWSTLWDVLATEREFRYESEHVAADGSAYPVEIAATYLEMDGQACGFFVARDLTEQRLQEARIRDLNASLERRVEERTAELAAANAELEAFSHSVSHDLRAPVNHLQGYAGALADCLDDDSRRGPLVRKIGERARHMNELIDALLALSRVAASPLARRDVDLSALAREIDADLRREFPQRTVETAIQPGLRASADPVLARTLLQNVIGNAWKYSSKVQAARIDVFSEHGQDGIQFAVRDNGAGFDPAYASKLFGAFQRLHSQTEFKGNGVGLATVRRIVARHGGRIWAESVQGRGATFRFTLP
jgi:PAS domain S-box-containing protein